MTFAVLNSDGVPEECELEQWQRWFFEGGGRNQMRIKRDLVNQREIETLFRGNSVEIGQGTDSRESGASSLNGRADLPRVLSAGQGLISIPLAVN